MFKRTDSVRFLLKLKLSPKPSFYRPQWKTYNVKLKAPGRVPLEHSTANLIRHIFKPLHRQNGELFKGLENMLIKGMRVLLYFYEGVL